MIHLSNSVVYLKDLHPRLLKISGQFQMDSTSRGSQMCRLGRINLKWLTNVMTQVRGHKFIDMQNGVASCMLSQSFHFLNINRMHNAWNENCIVTSPTYIVFITDSCFSHITQILGCPSFLRQIIWFYFWLQQQNSSHCWKPCFIIKNFAWFFFFVFLSIFSPSPRNVEMGL